MNFKLTFLVINQTAGSPYHGMVYRNYYMAKEWVKDGHRAIIISASYFHNFKTPPNINGLFTKEIIDGIEYWWVKLPRYSQSRSLGRFLSIFLFPLILFFFPFWKLNKPDAVIVSGPPHISIINAWLWAKIWGSTLIYEVRDIWPLTLVKLGKISPLNPGILIFAFFERLAYKLSDMVISVLRLSSDYFVSKGLKPSKFAYIPNGVDLDALVSYEGEISRKISEIKKTKKVVIYAGSFGIANNLDQFLDSASILQKRKDLHFVLVGDGPHRAALMQKIQNLQNVSIFDSVPKKEIYSILSLADIGYIGLLKSDLFNHGVSPNKLFDYMSAGLPVVMAVDTDDNIVENAKCGKLVRSCAPSDISEAIESILDLDEDKRAKLGKNAREFIENNHDYKVLASKYIKVISHLKKTVQKQFRFEFDFFIQSFLFLFLIGLFFYLFLPQLFPNNFELGMINLLKDQFKFHRIAVEATSLGWSEFTLRPNGQFPAGVLAFFYKITGVHQPVMILPLLSALGALSIIGTLSILRNLGVRGRWWPLVISIFFIITPTSLSWIIYPHKDSFIVPGIILISWSVLGSFINGIRTGHYVGFFIGSFLVLINKPYFSEIFLLSSVSLMMVAILKKRLNLRFFLFLLLNTLLFLGVALSTKGYLKGGSNKNNIKVEKNLSLKNKLNDIQIRNKSKDEWKPFFNIKYLDKPLRALANTRARFLKQYSHGRTNYFSDFKINSSFEAVMYIPRALVLGFFEPLPWRKNNDEGSLKEILLFLLKVEMIVSNVLIIFFIFSLKNNRNLNVALLIFLSISFPFLLILGYAVPNIGAVNRYRFPFLLLIKLAGFAALWNLFLSSDLLWQKELKQQALMSM